MENKLKLSTKIIFYVILILAAAVTLLPIFYTISGAFKTNSEILTRPESLLPLKPTLDNFKMAWNSNNFSIKLLTWNSTYYTLISVDNIINCFDGRICVCKRIFLWSKIDLFDIHIAYVHITGKHYHLPNI